MSKSKATSNDIAVPTAGGAMPSSVLNAVLAPEATPTRPAPTPSDEAAAAPVVPPVLAAALGGEAPGSDDTLTVTTDTAATVGETTMLDVDAVTLRPCDFILLPGEGDQIIARHVSGSLEFTGTRQEFNDMLRG